MKEYALENKYTECQDCFFDARDINHAIQRATEIINNDNVYPTETTKWNDNEASIFINLPFDNEYSWNIKYIRDVPKI